MKFGQSAERPFGRPISRAQMEWWPSQSSQQLLHRDQWVAFDLETILVDTLAHSPRIQNVSNRTESALERIVQQDAAFDSTQLLSANVGRTNDPVGNTLTTGGADRLVEESVSVQGGFRRTTRRGTELELTQRLGINDSNSLFFDPRNQGNTRLNLSLTQPLLDRGGRVFNERLIMQARIDSQVAWQDMRSEVEQRISDVIVAYWQLYQLRCEVTQQRDLLARGQAILRVLNSRRDFDTGRIEITKAQQRLARRDDQLLAIEAELRKQQARFALAVGSRSLIEGGMDLEMIPSRPTAFPQVNWNLRDCVARAMQNRPEIRSATHQLELSSLEIHVTRAELTPQLNAIFNGYLAALNGDSRVGRSLIEQFESAPGIQASLEYELPRGNRAARSRVREAHARYRQRAAALQEAIQQTQFEVESALIDLQTAAKAQAKKQAVLETAIHEENILKTRWETVGGDGSRIGILLENLLDAQQRRTDAERDWVATQTTFLNAMVQLQRAMGTLLINERIQPYRDCNSIHFVRDGFAPGSPQQQMPIDRTFSSVQPATAPPVEIPSAEDVSKSIDQQGPSQLPPPIVTHARGGGHALTTEPRLPLPSQTLDRKPPTSNKTRFQQTEIQPLTDVPAMIDATPPPPVRSIIPETPKRQAPNRRSYGVQPRSATAPSAILRQRVDSSYSMRPRVPTPITEPLPLIENPPRPQASASSIPPAPARNQQTDAQRGTAPNLSAENADKATKPATPETIPTPPTPVPVQPNPIPRRRLDEARFANPSHLRDAEPLMAHSGQLIESTDETGNNNPLIQSRTAAQQPTLDMRETHTTPHGPTSPPRGLPKHPFQDLGSRTQHPFFREASSRSAGGDSNIPAWQQMMPHAARLAQPTRPLQTLTSPSRVETSNTDSYQSVPAHAEHSLEPMSSEGPHPSTSQPIPTYPSAENRLP